MAVKSQGNRASNGSTTQLPEPPQTETPALPAERFVRAARLPEEGIARRTITPAVQRALSRPFPSCPAENYKPHSAFLAGELYCACVLASRSLSGSLFRAFRSESCGVPLVPIDQLRQIKAVEGALWLRVVEKALGSMQSYSH